MFDQNESNVQEHVVGMHQGEVLLKLAQTYPNLTLTLVEAVQNAIDAGAEKVFVGVDAKTRTAVIVDDGEGISVDKFRVALQSVGKGVKSKDKMGKFGLGMISPLDLCQRFIISSLPRRARSANSWEFAGAAIQKQHVRVTIPYRTLNALPQLPRQFVEASRLGTTWRTIVHLEKTVADKETGTIDLEEFQYHIRTKLRHGMLRNGTTVHVFALAHDGREEAYEIDVLNFTGEKLEIAAYDDPGLDCGKVTFELHRAPEIKSGARRGIVLLKQTGDTSYIAWRDFYVQAMGSKWLKDVKEAFDALGSGYFEGVISAENVALVKERDKFVMNDALRGLYMAIYLWFEEHGKEYFEDERDARREERYRGLAEKSLKRIMDLLDSDVFASMARRLLGTLPDTYDPEPELPEEGEESGDTKATRRPSSRRRKKRIIIDPPMPREKNPSGQNVTLRFAYEVLESGRLWEFDLPMGVLTFNILHPTWVKVDETGGKHTARHDRQVMHLQEYLAMKLLLLLSKHEESDFDLDHIRGPIDDEVRYYTEMFILGGTRS